MTFCVTPDFLRSANNIKKDITPFVEFSLKGLLTQAEKSLSVCSECDRISLNRFNRNSMDFSSHRIRTQEKQITRKIAITVGFFVGSVILVIFVGLPVLARLILFFSSPGRENVTENITSTPLFPPILDPLFESTNSSPIRLTGTAEKEAKVAILVNHREVKKVLVDKEGKFLADKITLSEGENTITAKTIRADKESSFSSPLIVKYIKGEPKLEIAKPLEGEKFTSEDRKIIILGSTDPGNKVTINDRLVIVDSQGNFSYSVNLSDGENLFKIKALDSAGNEKTLERKVTYLP